MVDTDGGALELLVHPADVQDRNGAVPLLKLFRGRHPFVKLAYADSAYSSPRVKMATSISIEIVRKFADQTGFVVHPHRLGPRTHIRVAQSQPTSRKGLRADHPIRHRLPLRCIRYDAHPTLGSLRMRFETDSDGFLVLFPAFWRVSGRRDSRPADYEFVSSSGLSLEYSAFAARNAASSLSMMSSLIVSAVMT